tara:strand:- start:352 stop:1020 length:669 start_codon:yes stop_codon:yes gene_type:complete
MRIHSKLCHVSDNKVIVRVNGWLENRNVGSALAEGPSVEIAEDKAINRLYKRIKVVISNELSDKKTYEDKINTSINVELPIKEKFEKVNNKTEPIDWSNELTEIDLEIQRLKWSRDDEIFFLEKNFGYNNRNKITKYSDILKYLSLLKQADKNEQYTIMNDNINKLIEESDSILNELSWNNSQGREYLQNEFNVSTRKELSEKQLISFIEKLRSIRNQYRNL